MKPYPLIPDFHKLASNNSPTEIIGDLNAKQRILGDNHDNAVEKGLEMLIDNNKLIHLGPDFPTFISHNSHTNSDIILCNNKIYQS